MRSSDKSPRRAAVWLARASLIVLILSMACGKSGSGSDDRGPESQAGADTGGSAGTSGTAATSGSTSQTGGRGGSAGTSPIGGAGEGGEGAGGEAPNGGLGGSVSAGSSAGGNSSAGMAGSGGLPSLPLPDGCEAQSGSENGTSCNLAVLCATDARINNCFRLTAGRWQCNCGRGRVFEIEGAEGLLACAVMAELCPVTEPEGDPSCTESERSDTNFCELEQACGRSVDVTEVSGARAWLMEYGSAVCERTEPGLPFECHCLVGDVDDNYGLVAQSGEDACQPLLDFCKTGETPTYDEPTQCIDSIVEENEFNCALDKVCVTPMRLTDEVSLARVEEWWSSCYQIQPTGSRCDCSGDDGPFDFNLTTDPTAPTCAAAILNCADYGNVERRGTVECQPQSQSAGLDSCNADLECLQPASVNGREIIARGRMKVLCRQRTAGEPWWCSCASNEDSAIFELGTPSATSWEACTAATGRCQDALPLVIGPSTGYPNPPDPLPPE